MGEAKRRTAARTIGESIVREYGGATLQCSLFDPRGRQPEPWMDQAANARRPDKKR